MPNDDHAELAEGGQRCRCRRCGATLAFTLPMPVREFTSLLRGFVHEHRRCRLRPHPRQPETWPPADPEITRAIWAHFTDVRATDRPSPSIRRVAAAVGCSPAMARRAVRQLAFAGYLRVLPHREAAVAVRIPLVTVPELHIVTVPRAALTVQQRMMVEALPAAVRS